MFNNSVMESLENWESLAGLLSESQKTQLAKVESMVGIQCLLDIWLNNTHDMPEGLFCNATWDNVYCWPPTPAGTVNIISCSEAFELTYPDHAFYLEGNASRTCLENGTWSQGVRTNYNECANSYEAYQRAKNKTQSALASALPKDSASVVVAVQYVLCIGSLLSLICLGISLGIFYYFRCLRCDRVTVTTHLMVALVIRFILLVIITEPFVLNRDTSYRDVDELCKGIIVVYLYGTVSSVSWMFIQGLYINTSLTTVVPTGVSTQRHFYIYYLIGWALPAILLTIYTYFMIVKSEQPWCWKGYANTDEMYYILLVPMFIALMLNLGFLLNIARIVYRKVQRSRSQGESSQLKATVKATVILFFVLGVNNLLIPYNPPEKYQNAFIIFNSFLGSTQGIVVSLLYCFTNNDVHEAVKRCYNRYRANRSFLGSGRRLTQRQFGFCVFFRRRAERAGEANSPEFV